MRDLLSQIKPLNTDQYDKCRERAIERVKARIGEKPTRAHFERELGRLWTSLDGLALVVFVAALAVSSAHIIKHMGGLAAASFAASTSIDAGTRIGADTWTIIHQWGYIALSEASMILFMVLFALSRNWRKWVYVMLALTAALFVFIANWQSGTGILESVMPPIFTLGIGFHLERLIVISYRRRKEIDDRYLKAIQVYETAIEDPTAHPDYQSFIRQEIWEKVISLKTNKEFGELPKRYKLAVVYRELERETWSRASDNEIPDPSEWQTTQPVAVSPASERPAPAYQERQAPELPRLPDEEEDTQPAQQPVQNGHA